MSSGRAVRLAVGAGLTLGCLFAYGALRDWSLFERLEGAALDLRFQARGERTPGPETVLVMIDEATLAASGGWPLSRGLLAEALVATFEQGARVVALDLLIDSWRIPDGTSPVLEAAPSDPGDVALLQAVETFGEDLVLPFAFVFEPGQRTAPPPDSLERAAYAVHRVPSGVAELQAHPLGVVTPPLALFDTAVPAYANVLLDGAGRLRLAHPALRFGDRYYPSLAVEAVRLYLGLPKEAMTLLVGEGLRIEERLVPTDRLLRFGVGYYGPTGTFPTYSLLDLLEGRLAPGALENKLVVIGVAALAVGDRFVTPFSRALPGAEYFATVADNLLHGRILRRDGLATGLDVLAIVLCAIAGASLHGVRRVELGGVLALLLLGLWAAASYGAFAQRSLWLDFTFPALALILTAGTATTTRLLAERRGQEALARYLPPLAVRRAGGANDAAPDTRLAAILFVDMRGFTTRSEDLRPAETMALMRGLHRRIEQAIT
ncbi:MAG: CHASE2 domain-containing protein, partial [Kiloniellales bacterium]